MKYIKIIIFLNFILELQTPIMTEDAIFPVPINPRFINRLYKIKTKKNP